MARRDRFAQAFDRARIGGQRARLQHRGEHGDIASRGRGALRGRTHRGPTGRPASHNAAKNAASAWMRRFARRRRPAPAGRYPNAGTVRRGRSRRPRTAPAHRVRRRGSPRPRAPARRRCGAFAQPLAVDVLAGVGAASAASDSARRRRAAADQARRRARSLGVRGVTKSLSSPGRRVRISRRCRSPRRCVPTAPTACGPGHHGPAVGQQLRVAAAFVDHRLDGEGHAGRSTRPCPGRP